MHTRMHTRAAGKMTVKTLATNIQNHPVLVFALKHIRYIKESLVTLSASNMKLCLQITGL